MKHYCNYKELISAFIDGELPPEKTAEVSLHLEKCGNCRNELESLQHTDTLLRGLQELEPSAVFERAFWQKVADLERKKARRSLSNFLLPKWRPYFAAALTVLLIFAFAVLREGSVPMPEPEQIIIAENIELLKDFEVINYLDLLENWEAITTLGEKS